MNTLNRRGLAMTLRRASLALAGLSFAATGPALAQAGATPVEIATNPFLRLAGRFPVGTRDYFWVDQTRNEPFTKDPNDKRRVLVQVWYPTAVGASADTSLYIRNPGEFVGYDGFKPVLKVKTNSVNNAPVAKDESSYPVLVYNHGGSWTRFSATFSTEWLASHGYIVVSVDHTGFNKTTVFPDGYRFVADTLRTPARTGELKDDAIANWNYLNTVVFPTWTADARFVLDRLEELNRTRGSLFHKRLDLDRIGVFGWSFGGATSVQLSKDDPRVKAAVDHDGQLFGDVREKGTTRPVMLIHNSQTPQELGTTDRDREVMAELVSMVRAWDSTFRASSTNDWYDVTIAKTTHGHFSDLTLFFPKNVAQLEPSRAHEIINAYTLAFFDKYLRGRDSDLLAGPSPSYPEVAFRKR